MDDRFEKFHFRMIDRKFGPKLQCRTLSLKEFPDCCATCLYIDSYEEGLQCGLHYDIFMSYYGGSWNPQKCEWLVEFREICGDFLRHPRYKKENKNV